MKKIITSLLIFAIFTTCLFGSSFAEGFSVRNGIKFGMSRDEVIRIEEANGYTPHPNSPKSALCYVDVNIAGIDNADVTYFFTDGILTDFEYEWTKRWFEKESDTYKSVFQIENLDSEIRQMKSNYEILNNALSNKYPEIGTLVGKNKIEYIDFNDEDYGLSGEYIPDGKFALDVDIYNFNQYLLQIDGGYVEIIANCYNYEFSAIGRTIKLTYMIKYRFIPDSLYQKKVEEANNLKQKIKDDL